MWGRIRSWARAVFIPEKRCHTASAPPPGGSSCPWLVRAEERRNACHEFAQMCCLTCLTCQVVGSVLEHLLQLVEHRPERPLTHLGDLPHTHLLPIFPLQLPAEALQLLRPLTLCW